MSMEIRGTNLYVDQRGPEGAPALLFIHGGPGSGTYDFLSFQGDALAKRLHLIAVDQRGVQHSDPLEGEVTDEDLIADFEAVREALGITSWSILGHSYGGRPAIRYAVMHPSVVDRVIFENPGWDIELITRTLVQAGLPLLRELGLDQGVEELLENHGPATVQMWNERTGAMHRAGDRRMEIYLGPASRDLKLPADELPEEIQSRAGRFAESIIQAPGFVESLLPLLSQLTQPALLIKGGYDPITSPTEIARFQSAVPDGTYRCFEGAGHFVHAEAADAYTQLVTDFVLA
ncbi:alpha/beta hydrolase [Streptomyces sp. SID13031]|uniref:alpha/beta fold hydrolase n=1 Tax=Streptomyces sp. SID13031 TaxID=2706046 RepID=UPI0013C9D51F|nr:alpha/beta hydrolase [Streptomyces sp. SID13031]NEA35448.1 alpha/beta hydrolase [Streptomyces sp. SID13031]